jgi:hypothetical protein
MKSVVGLVFCIVLGASGASAQSSDRCVGVEGAKPLNMVGHAGRSSSSQAFYLNASGSFVEADAGEGFLVIELGTQGPIRFPLDGGFKMSADKRTRLHGIKDLSLADLQRGDPVQVKFSTWDGRVVRLKLKKPRK